MKNKILECLEKGPSNIVNIFAYITNDIDEISLMDISGNILQLINEKIVNFTYKYKDCEYKALDDIPNDANLYEVEVVFSLSQEISD